MGWVAAGAECTEMERNSDKPGQKQKTFRQSQSTDSLGGSWQVSIVKPVLSGHPPKKTKKLVFNTDCRLMQVKSTAECS